MEKEFVPYELAVKLKALGFDKPCMYAWCITPKHLGEREGNLFLRTDGNPFGDFFTGKNWNVSYNNNKNKIKCSAATFYQAFRWFREEYKMNGYVSLLEDGKSFCYMIHEDISVVYGNRICSLPSKWLSHEEAELACLEKLIEIVETRTK